MFKKKGNSADAKYSFVSLSSDFFDINNWNYKKRKINIINGDNNSIIIESKDKGVNYLTLFEDNTGFPVVTKGEEKILLNSNNFVEIAGKRSGDIRVIIYLIEYDKEHKRIHTNKFGLNDQKIITAQPATRYARMAIRILGKGELHITKFITSEYALNQQLLSDVANKPSMQDIKMACIFDEFTMASFKDVVSLTTFSPDDWKSKLESDKPDLLMVESAWKGNFGSWEYEVGRYNNNNNNYHLKKLILWCKRNKVPTIFWNKEDPVHFEKFKNAAALFDYVYTTDADMIAKYRNHVGHDRIRSMQFAANPKIHNPISLRKDKKDRISFAGSYYANRHEDRKKDMDDVLKISQKFGLDIYDRNYERNKVGETDFQFPAMYANNVLGSLKYSEMYKAYKDYRLILNVNSVKYSPTMFSRRVFEGLACGTPIISSYSTGIKKTFYNIVTINEDEKQFEEDIKVLMTDMEFYRKRSLKGIRDIFSKHTYEKRMEDILDLVGINYKKNKRFVTIVFTIDTKQQFEQALSIVRNQSYKNIKVIILLSTLFNGYEEYMNAYNTEKILTYIMRYAFQYNALKEIVDSEYLTVMDIEHTYGKYYVEDMVYAGMYSDAEIIGKKTLNESKDYNFGTYEYQYVSDVNINTAMFQVDSIKDYSLKDIISDRLDLIEHLFRQEGLRIFSSDKFNFQALTGDKRSNQL